MLDIIAFCNFSSAIAIVDVPSKYIIPPSVSTYVKPE
jgi:hypothetical protein